MTPSDDLALFSLDSGSRLADKVAGTLGIARASHEERLFEDGEHKIRPLERVRGRDVYLLQSLHGEPGDSVNDQLIRLLFFAGALRDAGAARLTLIAPYLCYARKDRRTKPRDPVSLRYLAQLVESAGFDCIACMDVHNRAAFDNAFRCPTLHLSAHSLFIHPLKELAAGRPVTVASPDVGGIKRADGFREALQQALGDDVAGAFMEKRRSEDVVSGDIVAGTVKDRVVVIIDDLIAGGTTLRRAAEAFGAEGAAAVYAAVTHGLFAPKAAEALQSPALEKLLITDSVKKPRAAEKLPGDKLTTVSIAALLAKAIEHLHAA